MRRSLGSRLESLAIVSILSAAAALCILPVVHELSLSLSSNESVVSRKVGLWPVEATLE